MGTCNLTTICQNGICWLVGQVCITKITWKLLKLCFGDLLMTSGYCSLWRRATVQRLNNMCAEVDELSFNSFDCFPARIDCVLFSMKKVGIVYLYLYRELGITISVIIVPEMLDCRLKIIWWIYLIFSMCKYFLTRGPWALMRSHESNCLSIFNTILKAIVTSASGSQQHGHISIAENISDSIRLNRTELVEKTNNTALIMCTSLRSSGLIHFLIHISMNSRKM